MALYRYKAVTDEGAVLEGEMEAPDRAAVAEALTKAGHTPLRAEESEATIRAWLTRDLLQRRRLTPKRLGIVTGQIATLLQAGLPLERSFEIVEGLATSGPSKAILRQLLEKIRSGVSLADALAEQPTTFPNFYVSMVRAGEAGGSLDAVLVRLAGFLEISGQLKESIRSALIYPGFVMLTSVLSLVVLVGFVLPEFESMFRDAGAALPAETQFILAVGRVVEGYWWAGAAVVAGAILLVRGRLRNPPTRARWDRALLKIPVMGDLVRKIETARLTRTLGMLLTNGVTLPTALKITNDTVGNRAIAAAIGTVSDHVKEGRGLAEPLRRTGVLPQLATDLIQVGEETARLDDMLLKVADIYDREVRGTMNRMLAMLVPGLTIALGLLVAVIIGSVLLAILSIYQLAA